MQKDIRNFERDDIGLEIFTKLEALKGMLLSEGIVITAFRDDQQFQKLNTLSYIDQKRIAKIFLPYVDTVIAAKASNLDINDNKVLTKVFLELNNWVLNDDIIDKLAADDVVEIYNHNIKTVFRSINYFKSCSYSLLEVFSNDFWQLYEKDTKIIQGLSNKRGMLLRGEIQDTIKLEVPNHTIKEKFSTELRTYMVEQKYMSPVRNESGQPIAVLKSFKIVKRLEN